MPQQQSHSKFIHWFNSISALSSQKHKEIELRLKSTRNQNWHWTPLPLPPSLHQMVWSRNFPFSLLTLLFLLLLLLIRKVEKNERKRRGSCNLFAVDFADSCWLAGWLQITQTIRQTDRQTDRQRQTERQTLQRLQFLTTTALNFTSMQTLASTHNDTHNLSSFCTA